MILPSSDEDEEDTSFFIEEEDKDGDVVFAGLLVTFFGFPLPITFLYRGGVLFLSGKSEKSNLVDEDFPDEDFPDEDFFNSKCGSVVPLNFQIIVIPVLN